MIGPQVVAHAAEMDLTPFSRASRHRLLPQIGQRSRVRPLGCLSSQCVQKFLDGDAARGGFATHRAVAELVVNDERPGDPFGMQRQRLRIRSRVVAGGHQIGPGSGDLGPRLWAHRDPVPVEPPGQLLGCLGHRLVRFFGWIRHMERRNETLLRPRIQGTPRTCLQPFTFQLDAWVPDLQVLQPVRHVEHVEHPTDVPGVPPLQLTVNGPRSTG